MYDGLLLEYYGTLAISMSMRRVYHNSEITRITFYTYNYTYIFYYNYIFKPFSTQMLSRLLLIVMPKNLMLYI